MDMVALHLSWRISLGLQDSSRRVLENILRKKGFMYNPLTPNICLNAERRTVTSLAHLSRPRQILLGLLEQRFGESLFIVELRFLGLLVLPRRWRNRNRGPLLGLHATIRLNTELTTRFPISILCS